MLGGVMLVPDLNGFLQLDSKVSVASSLNLGLPLRVKSGGELNGNARAHFVEHHAIALTALFCSG